MHLAVVCGQLSCWRTWSHIETSRAVARWFLDLALLSFDSTIIVSSHAMILRACIFPQRSLTVQKGLFKNHQRPETVGDHSALIRNDWLLRRRPIETLYTDKSTRKDLAVEYLWHEKKEKPACFTGQNWFWWRVVVLRMPMPIEVQQGTVLAYCVSFTEQGNPLWHVRTGKLWPLGPLMYQKQFLSGIAVCMESFGCKVSNFWNKNSPLACQVFHRTTRYFHWN